MGYALRLPSALYALIVCLIATALLVEAMPQTTISKTAEDQEPLQLEKADWKSTSRGANNTRFYALCNSTMEQLFNATQREYSVSVDNVRRLTQGAFIFHGRCIVIEVSNNVSCNTQPSPPSSLETDWPTFCDRDNPEDKGHYVARGVLPSSSTPVVAITAKRFFYETPTFGQDAVLTYLGCKHISLFDKLIRLLLVWRYGGESFELNEPILGLKAMRRILRTPEAAIEADRAAFVFSRKPCNRLVGTMLQSHARNLVLNKTSEAVQRQLQEFYKQTRVDNVFGRIKPMEYYFSKDLGDDDLYD